jgi:hypothetical protein
MPLSRFPRYGVRLAPSSLREVLELPLPRPYRSETSSGALKFCDLDENVWQKFSREECVRFGQLVVETVRGAIPALPLKIQSRLIPPLPEGMALEDLQLEPRTYHCLHKLLHEGHLAQVADLGQKTIGDLLRLEGFGAKCLVDLLTSLEATQAPRREQPPQPKCADTGPQRQVRIVRQTIDLARKAIARFGVATVADVAARLTEATASASSAEFVTGVLEGWQGFEWLDREAGWFWIRSVTNNRVLSRLQKILSVAEAIEVGELRSGIARHHAMDGYAPPRRVLLELCRRLPYCQVEGSFVRAKPGLDWQTVLRGKELTMVKILKEYGPIMQRAKFEELCSAAGMKRGTFYSYLDSSSVIERYASGVYGLRGARVPPGLAESLIPHREWTTSVRLDHGWTKDRKIWIGYQLSESMVKNGTFSVPNGLKKFLQGKFALKAADENVMGTLSIRENSGWGLGPFYRRRGGEAGDTLLVVFDLSRQEALVSVGEEGILEPYQHETG